MQDRYYRNMIWLGISLLAFVILASLIHLGWLNAYHRISLITIMLNIIYASGLNLVLGVAGQFSLGHAGFIAIGAYASAIASTRLNLDPVPAWLVGLAIGICLAVFLALLVGIPTLRLKGDYLAIATLGISEVIRIVINNQQGLTNGPAGISGIPRVVDWWLVYIVMVLCLALILNYTFSPAGRVTRALNQDEVAAEAMGVNITKYKVLAFVIAAATAAMGGALQANYLGIVTPSDYSFNRSIDILIIVVFGGMGSFSGTILAAIVLGLLNLALQDFGQLRMIIYALAMILIMIFRPSGLLGTKEINLAHYLLNHLKNPIRKEVG